MLCTNTPRRVPSRLRQAMSSPLARMGQLACEMVQPKRIAHTRRLTQTMMVTHVSRSYLGTAVAPIPSVLPVGDVWVMPKMSPGTGCCSNASQCTLTVMDKGTRPDPYSPAGKMDHAMPLPMGIIRGTGWSSHCQQVRQHTSTTLSVQRAVSLASQAANRAHTQPIQPFTLIVKAVPGSAPVGHPAKE